MFARLLDRLGWQRKLDHHHHFVLTEPMAKTGASVEWAMKCSTCGLFAIVDEPPWAQAACTCVGSIGEDDFCPQHG